MPLQHHLIVLPSLVRIYRVGVRIPESAELQAS